MPLAVRYDQISSRSLTQHRDHLRREDLKQYTSVDFANSGEPYIHGKCLVQIQMTDIASANCWIGEANLRVEVGA